MKEILIDTSVLIDFLERRFTDREKDELFRHKTSISVLTYLEVLKFLLKIGKSRELEFVKQRIYGFFPMKAVTPEICEQAAFISHSHSMSLADAVIYATAKIHGITLYTSDTDLKGLPCVLYLKPRN